ncbi:DnaJ-like protein [Encephalitozoon intestinalis ATCC 50506]|uniref:DnaJ-like protein n=1 Tax=Encephalitozoon intestinalis (strain ATCC 50506) TaxID=876142 RepID=E0S5C3_ENCIT|nr:DnaJ-like protein [Encephalitozoon intestinalis ATCC 50506]ADM10908.1 DnaJ-like protein [Encephalitozoon intestinalis ATCC 50506]UTX44542.1 DnaJ domain-containing protein [Encephalitozoon intestinalis]
MGNRHSQIKKSPYEILDLSPISTKREIKDRYKTLILEVHPDVQKVHSSQASKEAVEIMEAYRSIMKSPPRFEFYNEELFRKDLRKYAEDFFERVSDYCGIPSAPKFGDPDFERFYQVFSNFRTQKTFETEEEKSEFCRNVRRIARVVRSLDKRANVESLSIEVYQPSPKAKEKKIKTYPFSCSHCDKGFHSRNQVINHFRSKKHFEKVSLVSETPKEYVENQIQEIAEEDFSEPVCEPCVDQIPENAERHCAEEQETPKKPTGRQEPVPFRTCAECKIVFGGRAELLMHLKTAHKNPENRI